MRPFSCLHILGKTYIMLFTIYTCYMLYPGLQVRMADMRMFPSGYMYHHDKKYIEDIKSYNIYPYVFHMCWTDNRDQKV